LSPNPENLSDPDRIMYPIHPTDVASALAWLRDHIAEYGGDPSNLALLGHSAGAGLVATVGTNETFLGAHGIGLDGLKCVGSFDTESYDIPRALQGDATQQVLYENAFGSDPSVWTEASPINHIVSDKGIPPFLIVKRGTLDRQQLEMDFGAALGTAGVWNQVIDATSLTHEQVNEHIGMAGDTVMTPPVMAFVQNQCFPGP
jgi:arylformamidase